MTKAYECDRCGELYGNPPELKVAANTLEFAGDVTTEEKEKRLQGLANTLSASDRRETRTIAKIVGGDLCEECAEEFREFWGVDDE